MIKKTKNTAIDLLNLVDTACQFLDSCKAESIVKIDIREKSSVADFMIIASGQSQRFIYSLADKLVDFFKKNNISLIVIEGQNSSNWVLVDANPIIVHLFKHEAREIYDLEKMWG